MQTVKIMYWALWALLAIPLIFFNLKRIFKRNEDGSKKKSLSFFIFISILFVLVSIFMFYSYRTTMASRYEIAAERYINEHAHYLNGSITYDQYLEKTAVLRLGDYIPDQDSLDTAFTAKETVRFQFGDWIVPSKYNDAEGFPDTEVLHEESNPVFLIYTMSDGVETIYYLIRLQSDLNGTNWKITYHDVLPEVIANDSRFNSYKPNIKNGKWYEISA